jgi:predicted HTH transcriptional regulator
MPTESQNIEFKESWRDEYQKWICGFANAQGGVLYVGVKDNGEVCGVKDARKLMEDIPNKVRDMMGILVEVNLREENKKQYLEIVTEAYPYPISFRGKYYQRSGATNQELKRAAALLFHPDPEMYVAGAFVKVGFFREGMDLVYQDALLSSHRSMPYNPDIANTFFRAGEIEAWGRGIERIITACKNDGFSTPEFRYDASGIWTTFKFEYPERATTSKSDQKTTRKQSKQTGRFCS